MKSFGVITTLEACLVLVECGRNESPKATPLSSAANVPKAETTKDEAPHAPDTRGMPGMSELLQGDDKSAAKASEKK